MKIQMIVVDLRVLDNYIDENVVPFAVCVPVGTDITKRQQRFLEKYYDRVVDKRGWISFYCNIINAWKCKEMNYDSSLYKHTKGKVDVAEQNRDNFNKWAKLIKPKGV